MKLNLKALKSNIFQLILFAIACLLLVSFIAFLMSNGKSFDIGKLGSLGDFFGGVLNPIFAFLAFLALLTTIILQASELKATRKELRKSAKAQKKQSKSLKVQNKATKLQIFENTFFQLISIFIEVKRNFTKKEKRNLPELTDGRLNLGSTFITLNLNEVVGTLLKDIKNKYNGNYDKFNEKNEFITGNYFGQAYQIIKFIDKSKLEDEDKHMYVNIFRAQFTKNELEFLFYHCLGIIGRRHFQKYVEKYEFFEHIILNNDIEKQLLEYDIKAFGKNEDITKRYSELKSKAQ